MKLVSYNCRGLGSDPKLMDVRDLIRSENPQILLIQETKMNVDEAIKIGKRMWSSSDVIVVDSRGASGGLCTLWNKSKVSLEFTFNTQHWILTKFRSRQLNNFL
jgi:exonuclease III